MWKWIAFGFVFGTVVFQLNAGPRDSEVATANARVQRSVPIAGVERPYSKWKMQDGESYFLGSSREAACSVAYPSERTMQAQPEPAILRGIASEIISHSPQDEVWSLSPSSVPSPLVEQSGEYTGVFTMTLMYQ